MTVMTTTLLVVVALLPRLLHLADFGTIDEVHHWIGRVERFSAAIAEGDWAGADQTDHPGVTLMWLASAGLAVERTGLVQGWASASPHIEHLAWLRFPSALLQGLLVPLAYLLLRHLVAPTTALVAALFWATSPYLIAHSRLLHLDALLTAFVTFSLLLLLLAIHQPPAQAAREGGRSAVGWRALLGSGVCAGLALLTKGPALILLPSFGLMLLWLVPAASFAERVRRAVGAYLFWLGAAALVVVLLWPAFWADPANALTGYFDEIRSNGGRPNGDGQFFLGRAVGDPGPLFYLLADLFRMTPAMTLGILALPLVFWRGTDERWQRQILLALAAFALFWTLMMTLGPKKFDRYVLPTWPALLVLAAAGLTRLAGVLRGLLAAAPRRLAISGHVAQVGLWSLVALDLGVSSVWYHPYYLSYYNPLLGGGRAAQQALLIGWGEGMDQVGAYLRSRPDIADGPVLSALKSTLQPFVPVPVKDISDLGDGPANYAVVYLESIQRGVNPGIYATIQQTTPLHTVSIHGIDYATIYQLPKPFERAKPARFGEALRLRGITIDHAPGGLTVTPSWDVQARPAADYQLFLHVIDAEGRRVAQIDVPPGGGGGTPTSAWEPGQQIAVPLPVALPADLPSGQYQVVLGVYDMATGARLPLLEGPPADPAYAGPDALLLDAVTIP